MSNLFSHLLIFFLLVFLSRLPQSTLSLLVRLLNSHSIILTSSFFLSSTYFLNSTNLCFKFFFIHTATIFHYFLFNSTIIVMIPLFYFSVSFYFYPCPYFQYHSFHSFLFLPSGPCISHLYPLDMKFLTFFHSFYLLTSHIISSHLQPLTKLFLLIWQPRDILKKGLYFINYIL